MGFHVTKLASPRREKISDLFLQNLLSVWMLAKNGRLGDLLINYIFPKQLALGAQRVAELQPGGISVVNLE